MRLPFGRSRLAGLLAIIGALGLCASAGTQVVMLGTGTPNADPDRSGPALAIVTEGSAYLVDAGPGVVRRAAAARRAGVTALDDLHLKIVFLTHLHSDHTAGLPDLLLMPWTGGRTDPLAIYGPPGTSRMARHIQAAWSEDRAIRLRGGEPSNPTGWRADAHDVKPGEVYRDTRVRVTAFAVPHGRWKHAYGYVFETKDRRVVVSGDTGPSMAVADACGGCDVLVHEVCSAERLAARTADWQRYHSSYHTTAKALAPIANRARPKLLLLYHQLYWGATDADLIRELRAAGYGGGVRSAADLEIY